MTLSWLAQLVFFTSYFIAWLSNELPRTTWVSVSAIAALIVAILLLVDNRGLFVQRPQA
jgi:hypothetical protein